MKRPGLTEAMRRTIEYPRSATHGMRSKAIAAGFITKERDDDDRSNYVGYPITPRGQAALAAPVSITYLQLQVLEWLEVGEEILTTHINSFTACCRKGWVNEDGSDLSSAGTTALNNMRAAMGSEEWKP